MREGWEIKKLKDVCSKITDGTHQTPKYFDEGYIFLSSRNVTSGKIDWDNIKYIDEKQHNEMHKRVAPKVGDILLAKNGTTGVAAMVDRDVVFDIYVSLAHLSPLNNISPFYLLYFINSPLAKNQFNKRLKGAGVPNLHLEEIREVEIPLPPLPEQQRIVAILDEAFAAIATAKANAEQNLKNTKELFESYLQGVFENGNWETKTINQISENLDSKRVPITKNVRIEGTIPYYGASGIVDYVADYLFNEDLLCVSEDGANLLARTYPIAFSITGKTWVNNHAHVLRFKNMVSQKFVELYLNSIKLNDFVSGMAQPKLNQAMLNKIPIPFPSITEQQSIVERLDALSSETKKLESIYQKKIADLEELKKSILQKAFAGELSTVRPSVGAPLVGAPNDRATRTVSQTMAPIQ
jgi:type I restriction enzyme S subunit